LMDGVSWNALPYFLALCGLCFGWPWVCLPALALAFGGAFNHAQIKAKAAFWNGLQIHSDFRYCAFARWGCSLGWPWVCFGFAVGGLCFGSAGFAWGGLGFAWGGLGFALLGVLGAWGGLGFGSGCGSWLVETSEGLAREGAPRGEGERRPKEGGVETNEGRAREGAPRGEGERRPEGLWALPEFLRTEVRSVFGFALHRPRETRAGQSKAKHRTNRRSQKRR